MWRKLKKLTKITKKADAAFDSKGYEDAAAMYAMALEVDPSNREATKVGTASFIVGVVVVLVVVPTVVISTVLRLMTMMS